MGQIIEQYPPFIKGLKLNEGFYMDVIRPLLDKKYPNLQYSASLIGYGSDVLGFDTKISMDHNWGPRLQLFVNESELIDGLNNYFRSELPFQYKNFPVNYTMPNYDNTVNMKYTDKYPVNHLIEISTFEDYLNNRYSIKKISNFQNNDWLNLSDQILLEITSGTVFYDGLSKINNTRKELKFYPLDIWKLRIAVLWNYIWNKEAFIGRSMEINDYIGLKINSLRIVNYLIKILFYLEKRYIPYSKWTGLAFKQLSIFNDVNNIIINIINENIPEKIEGKLCLLYEKVIEKQNKSCELPYIKNKTRDFFNRPYKVIFSENIVKEIINCIEDEEIKNINIEKYAYDLILDL
jgi:hypothetical protein